MHIPTGGLGVRAWLERLQVSLGFTNKFELHAGMVKGKGIHTVSNPGWRQLLPYSHDHGESSRKPNEPTCCEIIIKANCKIPFWCLNHTSLQMPTRFSRLPHFHIDIFHSLRLSGGVPYGVSLDAFCENYSDL